MGELSDTMAALDHDAVLSLVKTGLEAGHDPLQLVEEARKGMELVGEEFDKGNYFLMELMWAAEIFKDAMALISPRIRELYGASEAKGTIVMGTVKGDVHELGKNIVKNLLECAGYEVIDLGVDVPKAAFVESIKQHAPQVVGMSALLTAAIDEVNRTVEAIEEAGLRDGVKIIVGGGIVGEVKRSNLNVDHATANANEGVRIIEEWIGAGA
ncbi:MAG: cobalamin-binding protein [Chloroflexi bacterium]|nr:cobalamin-binding protein [Chloroflexota bacterium]